MRSILILFATLVLALSSQTAVSAGACTDRNAILADETEKDETEKNDENQGVGDEEPECE